MLRLSAGPTRESAWQLVGDAARLGQAIVRAGAKLGDPGSLEAAVELYVERGAAVDQAHRHLEQRRLAPRVCGLAGAPARAAPDVVRVGGRCSRMSPLRELVGHSVSLGSPQSMSAY